MNCLREMNEGRSLSLKEKDSNLARNDFEAPTLSGVNYDTTLGKNMIVFTGRGTDPYNIKLPWRGYHIKILVRVQEKHPGELYGIREGRGIG